MTSVRTQERALLYAMGTILFKPVDVIDEDSYYIVRVEDPYIIGKYHRVGVKKTKEIEDKIAFAINDIEWRLNGNELPTTEIKKITK